MPDHFHAFAEAADVPGSPRWCDCCGHAAYRAQVCTEPGCTFVACPECHRQCFPAKTETQSPEAA